MNSVRLFLCGALLWSIAGAATPDVDVDALLEQMPPQTYADQLELAAELSRAPADWAAALCARLQPAGEIDDTAVRDAIDGWTTAVLRPDAPRSARSTLAKALADALQSADSTEVQAFLLAQLGKVGNASTLAVIAPFLKDPELASHAGLARLSIEGAPPQPESTNDATPEVSPAAAFQVCAALTALVDARGEEALPEVFAALHHPSLDVRAHAERLLNSLTTPDNAAEIYTSLETEAASQRAAALRRLAHDDPAAAVEQARLRMDDPHPALRAGALETFALHAGPDDAGALIDRLLAADSADRDVLQPAMIRRSGLDLNEVAATRLADEDPAARRVLLAFLEERGARDQADAVLAAVSDSDPETARQAAKTLRRIAGPDHAASLLALLANDRLPETLRDGLVPALVGGLNEISDPHERLAPIQAAWPDASGAFRRFLQSALPGLDAPDGLALLVEDARDPDPAVRDGAIRALCRWNGRDALNPLLDVAESAPDETHHLLAMDRALQLIAQQAEQAKRQEEAAPLDQVRQRYDAALSIARRDQERTRIQDALKALNPPPEQTEPTESQAP